MKKSVAILGGGSWGTALALVLSRKDIEVDIWLRSKEQLEDIYKTKTNKKYLPGISLNNRIKFSNSPENVLKNKEFIIISLPVPTIRENLKKFKDYISEDAIIVNVSKGIENDSLKRVSEIVAEILPNNKYAMLSGPSHAEEVAIQHPTTVIAASKSIEISKKVQDLFMEKNFRVYTNQDLLGVELGGALKNVIALGAGISDGLGYGDNAKAALMTRGIFEMARLGESMGANKSTFLGLSGIGDLIVTCTSKHSRNRKAGILLGQGLSLEEAIERTGMVVEGIKTTKSVYEISKNYNVSMPITEEIYKLVYIGGDVKKSVQDLMARDKKSEMKNLSEELI